MPKTDSQHPLRYLISDRDAVNELAQQYGTPLYVYDGDRLISNLQHLDAALASAFSDYQICFALKANTNPHLLSIMKESLPSLGADCSSPGELYIAEQVGIDNKRRLYTGNYETTEELNLALASAGHLNLDDITSFDRLMKIRIPDEISFRLNPGFGSGSFPEVVTSGKEAKFGIQEVKIAEIYRRAKESGVKRFGIQCMSGSGNLDGDYFVRLLTAILTCARKLESELGFTFSFISLGGGYGVPYRNDEKPLDVNEMFGKLGATFRSFYDPSNGASPRFVIEPGKIVIADSAFLLARVSGIKESYKTFVGLDAGMNTFLRPALYKTYHKIFKVGDPKAPHEIVADFTGGICENTDRLATDRSFPNVKEGDLVAIMDVGAYGFSMASQYNTRPRPAEVLLLNGESRLIRQREKIQDLFSHTEWNAS
ncbi:MAG: diaminopimelate decarboxylase [Candidatus Marinimicrobia bacterium]|nr:diaminopimelate decarboxylase [Candidatus Neomarinimicrobiota bacterium]|tara:strand:- start:11043 stop:12320 length:1278 start_codon:yes stop_codon:yes gene_type:complete